MVYEHQKQVGVVSTNSFVTTYPGLQVNLLSICQEMHELFQRHSNTYLTKTALIIYHLYNLPFSCYI